MESLLELLPAKDQQTVRAVARRRTFTRNEIACHQGDLGTTLHLIDEGAFAVKALAPTGDELTVNVLSAGDCFGELAIIGPDGRRSATIAALEASVTHSLSSQQLAELRTQHPTVDRWLTGLLADCVRRLTDDLVEAYYTSADDRLVNRLSRLCSIYGDGHSPTEIRMTQDVLAAMAGTTRPTANQLLRALEEEGLLSLARGKITVLYPARLSRAGRSR